MKALNVFSLVLVLVGAINWGLWGFFQFDLVAYIAGGNATWLARLMYSVIGLAGIWGLRFLGRCKALCCPSCSSCDHEHGQHKGPGSSCKM